MTKAAIYQPLLPVGSGILWYTGTAPVGWLLCQGQSLLRASYPALFAVIGTTYGAVDGTHFTLPDLRDRFPLGSGTKALAVTGGALGHTHTGPSHTHTSAAHSHTISTTHQHELPFWRSSTTTVGFISPATWGTGTARPAILASGAAANTSTVAVYLDEPQAGGPTDSTTPGATGAGGTGATGAADPPYQVVNFAIKAF